MAETKVDKLGINHRTLKVNGINMHVAEKGPKDGPIVLFVHGFPELWFSWRHQITALADLGYRAVAPDMRGYGGTDAPADASAYTFCHTAGDLVALIDALVGDGDDEKKVFVVGHDWGAVVAWHLCFFRPDKVRALVNLSVVLLPRNPNEKVVEHLRSAYGDDYYMCKFQAPGVMESEIDEVGGAETLLLKFFPFRTPGPLLLPKGEWHKDLPSLPSWLSEEEFHYYVDQFQQKGFTGPLNYYRAMDLNWELMAPWTGAKVEVPTKFIVGDLDMVYHMPGMKDHATKGGIHKQVPSLEEVVVIEGAGHYVQQEKADEVTKHIYHFIKKF